MRDFIFAALPWIVIGVSIAFITANFKREKKNEKEGSYISIGISLGMCFGVAIGSLLAKTFGNIVLTYSICFGMLIGVVAGLFISKNSREKSNEQKTSNLSEYVENK